MYIPFFLLFGELLRIADLLSQLNHKSPLKPPCCRYIPTCSEYALIAVEKYGVVHGGWMAIKRILRCHPFHKGGYDPVK